MASKPALDRAGTMQVTAKEGKALLGNEKMGDTRTETSKKSKGAPKRSSTINKTMEEAQAVYGKLDLSEGRSLRKRAAAPAKPALGRAGTMQNTAKEGKAFLKKAKAKKSPAKKAKKEEVVVEEEEENEEKSE